MFDVSQIETIASFVIYAVFNEMHKLNMRKDFVKKQ